jgi:pimeloyl-ACP methyl ester carboxylesterase
MATTQVNGTTLFYELQGQGDIPLVLVHGSWDSHHDWDAIVPNLSRSFRVLAYDRRGHSQSEKPTAQGSVREDVDDLAALVEELELAPVWVIGNSFGGTIALRLATERPDLLRGIIVHEPPLFGVLADDEKFAPMLREIKQRIDAVVRRISVGDHAGAAEQFVETVALREGTWAQLPAEAQQTFIENAPTFLDETRDPEQVVFDPEWMTGFPRPTLLTIGEKSPPIFAPVLMKLSRVLPTPVILPDAGHIPHVTHPDAYTAVITTFVGDHEG